MSKVVVFDLDDTIYKEVDYLHSAFREISEMFDDSEEVFKKMLTKYENSENVFEYLCAFNDETSLEELKKIYRKHQPDLKLNEDWKSLLKSLKNKNYHLGLLTDGYKLTQNNKIVALGIKDFFDKIIISEEFGSEKPDNRNYKVFERELSEKYYYIGDNISKDFVTPNKMGWETICMLDDGRNIHPQNFDNFGEEFQPKYKIKEVSYLYEIIV